MQVSNFIFFIIFLSSILLFSYNFKKIYRNINLGRGGVDSNNKKERWKRVIFIAFGQSKMFDKPFVAILHLIVYLGLRVWVWVLTKYKRGRVCRFICLFAFNGLLLTVNQWIQPNTLASPHLVLSAGASRMVPSKANNKN